MGTITPVSSTLPVTYRVLTRIYDIISIREASARFHVPKCKGLGSPRSQETARRE